MSPTPLPTLAIFGSTGGVTNSILIHALRNSQHVIVLVRTPSKLTTLLTSKGVSSSTIETYLTIIQGNALSIPSVITTLTANNTPDYIVPNIVTGLGAAPKFGSKPPFMSIDQPTICGDAAGVLVKALKQIYATTPDSNIDLSRKPKLTFISTTGISPGPEDVPFGLRTLYHYILYTPHVDKKIMEKTFRDESPLKSKYYHPSEKEVDDKEKCFQCVTGIRPTLLTGGDDVDGGKGWKSVRAGKEEEPTTGWSINRVDVGEWVWINVLGGGDEEDEMTERKGMWEGNMISLAG